MVAADKDAQSPLESGLVNQGLSARSDPKMPEGEPSAPAMREKPGVFVVLTSRMVGNKRKPDH